MSVLGPSLLFLNSFIRLREAETYLWADLLSQRWRINGTQGIMPWLL
jgi:hypothetical protein